MNKQTEEALKMAIEAMNRIILQVPLHDKDKKHPILDAIQACKEALEQPAQSACEECIGFNKQLADENDSLKSRIAELQRYAEAIVNRPTHPAPSWQSLNDDEIQNELKNMWDKGLIPSYSIVEFARAIEQALKEKNYG